MMEVAEFLSLSAACLFLIRGDLRDLLLDGVSLRFSSLNSPPIRGTGRSVLPAMRVQSGSVRVLAAITILLTVTGCGGGWSSNGGQPPVITGQPANQTVPVGQTATFTVTATSATAMTYQWYLNGAAISGATSSTYTTPATASADTGAVFTATVTNAAGSVPSTPATLTVAIGSATVDPNAPLIITQPANQTVQAGQTATFTVTATGAAPFTYQWYKGGVLIAGADSSTYTTPATTSADSGSIFTVTVANALGTVTSNPATLTVITPAPTPPAITGEPINQTVTAGQTATFNVTASGTGPLTYQWYQGGVAIGGATSSTYTTPATTGTNSGSVYTVTVTNPGGTVTSAPATLTVNTAPIVVTSPANQTVTAGQTAIFRVTATGTAPLAYQWYKDGTSIAGATSSTYITPATTSTDSGSHFTVTVTNVVASVTGGPATLTVNTAPAITTPPADETVTAGQTATFGVTATGTAPLTYQWYKNGAQISGATSASYTTPATASGDSGAHFTVTVTNVAGTATGGPATLTVNTVPTITTPADETVTAGQTATFSVTTTGTAPLTYQWYKNGAQISGATSASYTTPATASGDSGAHFTVTVTNVAGSATSGQATLKVNTPPTITTPPASQTVIVGQTATFTVIATGTSPLSYRWFKGGALISGATSSTYTTPAAVIGDNASQYTVTVTNVAGSATGGPATLTVKNSIPVASFLACNPLTPPYNSSTALIPTFSGGTAVIGSAGVGSLDITASAVSGSSYATPLITSAKTYTLSVTGTGGAVSFTTCTVVPLGVTISRIVPSGETVAPGTQAFTATVSGGATDSLTWAASGGTFVGNVWTSPNAVGTYTITATSVDEPSVSATTTMTISLPVITTQPSSENVCTNSATKLSVVASYATSYQWNLNGTPIHGATSSSYFIPSAASMDSGNYTVTVTNGAGSVTSNVAKVVVGSTITSNPVSLSILINQTATFSVAATGEAPFSYQWYVIAPGAPAPTAIPGATSSTYTTPVATTNSNGAQYFAKVTDACGGSAITSVSATLIVNNGQDPPTIITQPISQTVPAGGTATFTVVAAGTPTLLYQWYQVPAGTTTSNAITGATSASYTVPDTATTITNDQDAYYVIVINSYGRATSIKATLAVGSGILITQQPANQYVNAGSPATFSVTAVSALTLTYQWFVAAPGSSSFVVVPGATSATYTQSSTTTPESGSVYYVVVSNGTTSPVTSTSAALFVGALSGIGNLCEGWTSLGDALTPAPSCSVQLSASKINQEGSIIWPTLISTGNIQLSFTITTSEASTPPADGFALVLGDPSLGATPTSTGLTGEGLGAEGIPGFVLAFDDFENPGDPPIPYLGVTRGEIPLWKNPYSNVNTNIPALATTGATVSHDYVVSIVQGMMTVTMDGTQVFSGSVSVPPVAYLYFTASTGTEYELAIISNLSATVSAPSN
jgi:hypothetical protein